MQYNKLRLIIKQIGRLPQVDISNRDLSRFLKFKDQVETVITLAESSNDALYLNYLQLVGTEVANNPFYKLDQETHNVPL